jgi:hypothetical protein
MLFVNSNNPQKTAQKSGFPEVAYSKFTDQHPKGCQPYHIVGHEKE